MPNRILRDGILTSERVNSLSWSEEVFYRRLMSVVDDYGRYNALPMLLRASCYPLHIDKVSDADIDKWLTSCVRAGLVSVYSAKDGKRYIEIVDFGQQRRSKSKFPEPVDSDMKSNDINCQQKKSNAHLDVFGDGDGVEDVNDGDKSPFELTKSETWKAGKSLLEEFGMPQSQTGAFIGKLCKQYGEEVVMAAIGVAITERKADPASYIVGTCKKHTAPKSKTAQRQSLTEKDYTKGAKADGTIEF